MKKGGFLRNVLDTIRSNQATGSSGRGGGSGERGYEFGGQLKPSHFSLCQVARHGFPDQPTAIAFDPVQKIVAIGTKSGALRIFGRPGAEICVQHEPVYAITHIRFVVNQGAIITVTADESIHLWSLRGPNLKLQFTAGGQGNSPQASSPAPTPASNISSVSPQSGSSITTSGLPGVGGGAGGGGGGGGGGTSTATSPSSFLGQITDTVSGAVDSASDFLSGGGTSNDHFSTASLTGETARQSAHKHPEILHTLKFQREHITYIHQTLTSKWLYIGTERGNVHVANIETFELSGYSIAWNKAIELSRKAHPGAIIHLSECPQDTNKLLIGYESGCIVLWDLKQRNADGRYYNTENLLWLAWHYEGKQFVAAHGDGSLATWQTRSNQKPALIQYPHAKTAGGGGAGGQQQYGDSATGQQLGAGGAASLARSLCNELYRPINKVEWKTSKSSNEQFYLFSGGLPYDGFDQLGPAADSSKPPSRQSGSAASGTRQAGNQQYLQTATSAAGGQFASPSPLSPSISPSLQQQDSFTGGGGGSTKTSAQASLQREKKCLRSTSLTVMYGKSITVLEMDDTIIDFITICDHSPYENDSSDPYAVIVLLSNELILIDLTSSGYPSFDSPYSSTSLNESPVTCVQYLADCSSDLIPFLYSTSQNVISRAPKKGFSDKEWPINGGEWGQSMQSYPELVLTGHADGTIKFWDMSGVNFDLISKIKTSKLFEKPNKPPNAIFISMNGGGGGGGGTNGLENVQLAGRGGGNSSKRMSAGAAAPDQYDQCSTRTANDLLEMNQTSTTFDESIFAIEKIEFCSATKRLLVAGACAQVIQFKLSKKESHASTAAAAAAASAAELTTIMVEPTAAVSNNAADQHHLGTNQAQWKQHSLLQVKSASGSGASGSVGSSSCGSSSSSSSTRGRSGLSGFSAELICLTPLLVSTMPPNEDYTIVGGSSSLMSSGGGGGGENQSGSTKSANIQYYCQVAPKITALAFQATHNILAYAHKSGIVLVDIIQKCVIINASLSDLYGGAGSSSLANRDISIQPYATSSILQHHYQQQTTSPTSSAFVSGTSSAAGSGEPFSHHLHHHSAEHGKLSNNGSAAAGQQPPVDPSDNERTMDGMLNKPSGLGNVPDGGQIASPTRNTTKQSQPTVQSRYTNSMFQRQLSTNALNTGSQAVSSPLKQPSSRLFQRQMTASQLFSSGNNGSGASPTSLSFASCGPQQDKKRLLASARADLNLASSSTANLTTTTTPNRPTSAMADSGTLSAGGGGGGKKVPKNKRILSRMLSISAIHTTVGSSSAANVAQANDQTSTHQQQTAPNLSGYQSDETGGGGGGGGGDQQQHQRSDKFDSSFRRSRSSSTSSTNGGGGGGTSAGGANVTQSGDTSATTNSESIQCLAFVDPAQAGALFAASGGGGGGHQAAGSLSGGVGGSASSAGPTTTSTTTTTTTTSGTTSASSAAQAAAAAAAAAGHQVQSSTGGGSNHKSLSPIDLGQQAAGQLALWLGTSSGGLLLVGLQMPDNEDNRVLQLQSINAEPIPQTSIKLSGQILCLTAFTCEARAQVGSSQLSSGSAAARSTSQSSSLEGDTLMQSPSSSASSGSASGGGGGGGGGGGATSGGGPGGSVSSSGFGGSPGPTGGGASFDVRSSLFLAVVSEKQARVYQVASSNQPWSQQQQQQQQYHSSAQTSQSGGGKSHTDHHHHHHHRPHSSMPLADTPLASLLTNKKNLVAECDISDSSFACCSAVVQMRTPDECCLVSYLANGNLIVHSLPRLKPVLMDADFVPYTSSRISSSMRFARNGHCLYQPSWGEISKFTISSQYKSLVNEMLGLVYVPREMPEMPRTNFFKSLFSVSQSAKQSDRDELFGECSAGKPVRGVAKHIGTGSAGGGGGGSGGQLSQMDKLKSAAVGTMGHDMRVAREGLDERGEKLSEIEDQTLRMLNQSESYSQAAHQLAQKFKDKKWYQF